jgi:hypothetical protein
VGKATSPPAEFRPPDRPARIGSKYRLQYPTHLNTWSQTITLVGTASCTEGHAQGGLYYLDKVHLLLILYRATGLYCCVIIMACTHDAFTYRYLFCVVLNIC